MLTCSLPAVLARADLAEAEAKAGRTPWVIPSVLAVLGVWLGWSFATLLGALAGGLVGWLAGWLVGWLAGWLVGWFAAQAYLASVRNHYREEVALASRNLETVLGDLKKDHEESPALRARQRRLFADGFREPGTGPTPVSEIDVAADFPAVWPC